MRNINCNVISGLDNATQSGTQIDANQLVSASFHAYFGDSNAGGTFKLQASNDIPPARNMGALDFTVTNWVDIPTQTATISSGASALLTITQASYRWLRAVFTPTAAGVETVTTIADTGVKQIQTITAIADTGAFEVSTITAVADSSGSLNSTYFTFSAMNTGGATQTNYYVWYNINSAGVDPALAGKTGIVVAAATDASDSTIASATRSAVTSIAGSKVTVSGATNQAIITGKFMGNATSAADGAAPTGFTIVPTNGAASNLNSTWFAISSVNLVTKAQKNFYVWLNINSEGTDPLVASKTAVPVAVAAGASANTVGAALRSALGALTNDFTQSGSNQTCIATNKAFGLVTAISQGTASTGFTLANTTPGVASNLNNTYFLIQDAASTPVQYYVWINVDTIGTDPGPIGSRTAVPVAISSGSADSTVATAVAAALDALAGLISTASGAVATVTMANAGPWVVGSDVSTGFTIAKTGGGSTTINVNMDALSV